MSDNTKITIDKKTNLIGLSNISISRAGDDVYISNTNLVYPGLPSSFSVYKNEKGTLESTGEKLTWNEEFGILNTDNALVQNELSFASPVIDNQGTFATIKVYEYMPGLEKLTLLTREKDKLNSSFEIDQMQRVTIVKRLNIKQKRLVRSSIGSFGDQQGDIAINRVYFYYCHTDYDGSSNIWSRWRASEEQW
jgi:hypothetical protein